MTDLGVPREVLIAIIVVFVVGLIIWASGCSKDKYKFNNADYQYYPAPITVQNKYYEGIQNECGGNTYDYDCLQKVRFKSFRGDMQNLPTSAWDAQTWVCKTDPNVKDEESFYRCLGGVYADYKYP